MMIVSLVLTAGPYQVLNSEPCDGENIEGIVAHFREILSQPPETWTKVECNAQARGPEPHQSLVPVGIDSEFRLPPFELPYLPNKDE
jgi:hypothetical protein